MNLEYHDTLEIVSFDERDFQNNPIKEDIELLVGAVLILVPTLTDVSLSKGLTMWTRAQRFSLEIDKIDLGFNTCFLG